MGSQQARAKLFDASSRLSSANCKAPQGVFRPEVSPLRCEGKGACVTVCPYNVFVIGRITDEVFGTMPMLVKFKLWAHGKRTAYTPNSDACQACGLCVAACPEKAIRLVRNVLNNEGEGSR